MLFIWLLGGKKVTASVSPRQHCSPQRDFGTFAWAQGTRTCLWTNFYSQSRPSGGVAVAWPLWLTPSLSKGLPTARFTWSKPEHYRGRYPEWTACCLARVGPGPLKEAKSSWPPHCLCGVCWPGGWGLPLSDTLGSSLPKCLFLLDPLS